jgi:RNA polymerase sigma factor (sigma-70 family)
VFPKWERIDNPPAYLRTAIVNASHSWKAKRGTERAKLPLLAEHGSDDIEFDAMADLLAQLPHRQRAVLVLRFYVGLSEAEIAETLGCKPGTVKSAASRALAALKKGIEQ